MENTKILSREEILDITNKAWVTALPSQDIGRLRQHDEALRAELERKDAEIGRLRGALEAVANVMWMAERHADGGGSHSIEMSDYCEAQKALNAALSSDAKEMKP